MQRVVWAPARDFYKKNVFPASLVRPQAGETSHKKQLSCGRARERFSLLFPCFAEGFASAEATKGLSGRPLETFGADVRNLPQITDSLWRAGGKERCSFFLFRREFRLCGGDQRAFRSPFGNLRPFAASRNLYIKQLSCRRQEKSLTFFSRITKGFASAEATKGLSDRPLETFGPFNSHLPCKK